MDLRLLRLPCSKRRSVRPRFRFGVAVAAGAFVAIALPVVATAQTIDMGSDGSYGPIQITEDTVLTLPVDGVFHATSVVIEEGATLAFESYDPLVMPPAAIILATDSIEVYGTIDVSGEEAIGTAGGLPGPGGFRGGASATYRNAPRFDQPFTNRQEAVAVPPGGDGSAGTATSCALRQGGSGGGGSLVLASNVEVVFGSAAVVDARGGPGLVYPVSDTCQPSEGEHGNVRIAAPTVRADFPSVFSRDMQVGALLMHGNFLNSQGSSGWGSVSTSLLGALPLPPRAQIVAVDGVPVSPTTEEVVMPVSSLTVEIDGCPVGMDAVAFVRRRRTTAIQTTLRSSAVLVESDDPVEVEVVHDFSDPDADFAELFPHAYCTYPELYQ